MLKNPLTQTDCFRIVFAKILRKDIRLGSGGFRKLHEIEQDLGDFTVTDYGSVRLNVFAKTKTSRTMAKKLTTSLTGFKERQCTMAIVLDIRSNRKDVTEYPVKARFTIDRRSYYYPIGGSYSKLDFSEICNVQKSKSPKYEEKKRLLETVDKYKEMLVNLNPGHELTLDAVRMVVEGKVASQTNESFIGIWEEIIHNLRTENNGARYTTAEPYESSLRSFQKFLWKEDIKGFEVNLEHLKKWEYGMINGAVGPNGEELKPISITTRSINLRHCRAVWNECRRRGYLLQNEYPFSNVKKGLIAIPAPASRKEEYLDVERMTQLYQVFINKNYPSTWKEGYTERAHYSLGLFLVQYLGNGFNLVDVGQLTYSQYYFDTERKAFKFYRKKTRGRSTNGSEVIIPITEPLQRILDDIAAPPKLNANVFPHVLEGATHERDIRKRVSGENSNVQDRVIKICKDVLHWEVRPSGTWARHSFATNLTHAGVERSYIQESMGHSQSQSVTDRYIANYPLEKQMEYNSKLLNLNPTQTITKKDIKKMSKAEMAALLTELMEKK